MARRRAFICITLSSYEGPYTHEEILVIMDTPEWSDPNPRE